jgi:hypothetical protein
MFAAVPAGLRYSGLAGWLSLPTAETEAVRTRAAKYLLAWMIGPMGMG